MRDESVHGFEVYLRNDVGALNDVTSITKEYGIDMHYIETLHIDPDKAVIFMALNFANSSLPSENFLRKLISLDSVFKVNRSPSIGNILFTEKFWLKDLGGYRAILIDVAGMNGLVKSIRREFGESAGRSFLYHLGVGMGVEIFNIYIENLGLESLDRLWILLQALFRGGGWGDLVDFSQSNGVISFEFKRLWECELQADEDGCYASSLIRGILSGIFINFLDKDVVVKEVSCIARGDRVCKFDLYVIS
jgi:hypothetical protein